MRWLTRDPIEESGGVNLYAMCGNNAVAIVDVLGLEWIITRESTKRWAIAKKTNKYDSILQLADLIKLDYAEAPLWMKSTDNPCALLIPNLVCVYTSKSGWFDGIATFNAQIKRMAVADANEYKSKGFMVDLKQWASSDDTFCNMWSQEGIYAISFAGHGSKLGFIADISSGMAISPDTVHPPYHLAAIKAYSCYSAMPISSNTILSDGSIPTTSWTNHVSSKGTFLVIMDWLIGYPNFGRRFA